MGYEKHERIWKNNMGYEKREDELPVEERNCEKWRSVFFFVHKASSL